MNKLVKTAPAWVLGLLSMSAFADVPKGMDANQAIYEIVADRSDNFNGNSLDPNKWVNAPKSLIVGAWTFAPANAFVKDGVLNIAATQETHTRPFPDVCQGGKTVDRTLYYKSGAIHTHAKGVYGFYEAKIKGVKIFPGLSPAFWLYSTDHPYPDRHVSGSVDYSEIDIVELQQADWRAPGDEDPINVMDHNLHARIVGKNGKTFWRRPKPYPEAQLLHYKAPFDPSKDYHTYVVENRKDKISWYVDGVLVGSKPNLFWHRPMRVILSMGLRRMFIKYNPKCQRADPNPNYVVQDGYPEDATMKVDYVKTWKVQPSLWLQNTDSLKSVKAGSTIDVQLGYHAGSDYHVAESEYNGLSLNLVEMSQLGVVDIVASANDPSVAWQENRYAGQSNIKLDLSSVKPSSDLPNGNFYALLPVFKSSNGQDIYLRKQAHKITLL
ncbi:hypothetical protein C2869_00475 [Saccharobesus litoralis]|uniref:GH16 domain-containing protein n=1 Tax=Saccharobesus litoralis TaxID=2172099 RepID=A0A2S0VLD0_9ALTE|nr:family 16 glycosylhydrolase [Saccharobesus litoralis]AWB65006.1 hypothetical protein C2869_00475 [Saccharobesus litoralis]